jgi:hypothetical protein
MCLCFQSYTSHFRFLHYCILFTLNFLRTDVGVTLSILSLFQFLFISLLTFRAILTLDFQVETVSDIFVSYFHVRYTSDFFFWYKEI